MQRKDVTILEKILEEIELLECMLDGVSLQEFSEDKILQRACAMSTINVGELAKRLSEGFHEEYPECELKDAARTRDVYAHGYYTLDMKRVYNTAIHDFPRSKKNINKVLIENQVPSSAIPEKPAKKLTPEQAERDARGQVPSGGNGRRSSNRTR